MRRPKTQPQGGNTRFPRVFLPFSCRFSPKGVDIAVHVVAGDLIGRVRQGEAVTRPGEADLGLVGLSAGLQQSAGVVEGPQQLDVFLQAEATLAHELRMGPPDVAEVPGLGGDAGDALFACLVAFYEAVVRR